MTPLGPRETMLGTHCSLGLGPWVGVESGLSLSRVYRQGNSSSHCNSYNTLNMLQI